MIKNLSYTSSVQGMSFDVFFGMVNQSPISGNLVYASVLYAQAVHETGNFTSTLYKQYNNLFGMRPSRQRTKIWDSQVTINEGQFATYAQPLQSVLDRIDLDLYNGVQLPLQVSDVVTYMQTVLHKGYASDPQYLSKWIATLKSVGNEVADVSNDDDDDLSDLDEPKKSFTWIYLIVIAVALFFAYKWWQKRKKSY